LIKSLAGLRQCRADSICLASLFDLRQTAASLHASVLSVAAFYGNRHGRGSVRNRAIKAIAVAAYCEFAQSALSGRLPFD